MSRKAKTPQEKQAKAERQQARDAKRKAAVDAKAKAKKEAEEKGLPWNDNIPAARFLEDYDSAFMSAVAGSPKAGSAEPSEAGAALKRVIEVDQAPVQTETKAPTAAELVKMAKEAVGRTTGETATDNDEEIEPLTTTGVDVVAKENPESDTPAEEAPDNSYNEKDPSTWLVDTNGGLVRLPSESNKKYGNRKHQYKMWKKKQKAVQTQDVSDETRNGEPPVLDTKELPNGMRMLTDEEVAWFNQVKITVPEHVPVDWSIEQHEEHIKIVEAMKADAKSAHDSANVIEAAAMGQTDEQETETKPEVLDTPDASEAAPDAEQAEPDAPQEAPQTEPVQTDTAPEPTPTVQQPVTKPTLTLASSQSEDEALAARAQKFYGSTWTAERAEKLTKAFKFLEMAIRLQQKGESDSRINMPMTSAIRLETEALGIAVAVAKAA